MVSRLRVAELSLSSEGPGGSVDLSLEANAIALRYLSDAQLSRLSLGGHAPHRGHAPSADSLLSPTNMSVATRKYLRKYGLMEEEPGEEPEEEPRPQSHLIQNLQLLTDPGDRRPSLPREEGSLGNILDLGRLRRLPKLF